MFDWAHLLTSAHRGKQFTALDRSAGEFSVVFCEVRGSGRKRLLIMMTETRCGDGAVRDVLVPAGGVLTGTTIAFGTVVPKQAKPKAMPLDAPTPLQTRRAHRQPRQSQLEHYPTS